VTIDIGLRKPLRQESEKKKCENQFLINQTLKNETEKKIKRT